MNLLNKKFQQNIESKFVGCCKEDIETAFKNATNFKELDLDFETLCKKDIRKTHQIIEDLAHSGDDGKGSSLSHKITLIKEKCHLSVAEINDKKLPIINLVIKSECTKYEFLYCITPIGSFVADGFSMMGNEVLYKDWFNIYCKACDTVGIEPKYNKELLSKLRKKYYGKEI